jgi:hypothetical protein
VAHRLTIRATPFDHPYHAIATYDVDGEQVRVGQRDAVIARIVAAPDCPPVLRCTLVIAGGLHELGGPSVVYSVDFDVDVATGIAVIVPPPWRNFLRRERG